MMEKRYAIRRIDIKVNVGRSDTLEKARIIKANLEADDLELEETISYEIYDMQEKQIVE